MNMFMNSKIIIDDDLKKSVNNIKKRFKKAFEHRQKWDNLWLDCYRYTMPNEADLFYKSSDNSDVNNNYNLYDSTAMEAVENLSANMLSQITPAWSNWFSLSIADNSALDNMPLNEKTDIELQILNNEKIIQSHFNKSNFYIELHQCYIDLITVGTACLLFEENKIGEESAFKFTSIPMSEIALEENFNGKLDTIFRRSAISVKNLIDKFTDISLSDELKKFVDNNPNHKVNIIECVYPNDNEFGTNGYKYISFVDDEFNTFSKDDNPIVLKQGLFPVNPFICFRWLKTSGEIYGRSPVMKALPDIKTANKVVELILKNASIAVSGIWQAEDDGVINLDNIKLSPGTIIPKAVGSAGLSPLQTSCDFDVSQLVLNDLRNNIKKCLLADNILAMQNNNKMTATEINERVFEMDKVLGATFGRLQFELLNPIIKRAVQILKRRGEIDDISIDGFNVSVSYSSPIAKAEKKREAANIIAWIQSISNLGNDAIDYVDKKAVVKLLNDLLGIPDNLIVKDNDVISNDVSDDINKCLDDILNQNNNEINEQLENNLSNEIVNNDISENNSNNDEQINNKNDEDKNDEQNVE